MADNNDGRQAGVLAASLLFVVLRSLVVVLKPKVSN